MHAHAANDLEGQIRPMMTWMSRNPDGREMLDVGNAFILRFPPQRALAVATAMSLANPFFLPKVPDQAANDLAVPLEDFAEIVMRAKLTAKKAKQSNVLIAAAPFSGADLIQSALVRAAGLPEACLHSTTLDGPAATAQGGSLREQEVDELALIQNGLNMHGYTALHAVRCTPYMSRLLSTYGVRPIVASRGIADTIVSLEAAALAGRAGQDGLYPAYFADGLPGNFHTLGREERLTLIAHRWTPWLVQFFVSWRICAREGLAQPLFLTYEEDMLGDLDLLAARIADFVGYDVADIEKVARVFADPDNAAARSLKTDPAGRGADLPATVAAFIQASIDDYRDDVDLTPLVGAALA
ncbi:MULTISPECIES: hypothetical protein [unclassified Rhizobium]|uniref:hypothetical protein n=1 Tax=unclassified Rhizobium TaxID=2613769 RepID=UPI0016014CB1|nr:MULTISPECIES: hypothetical protein [unclassified Rhizobium]MBB1248322.1 hypothetical protein [Rhizobium sp. G21]MCV3765661.1 hypothetical protein [Rhizobium sp. TRM95796]